MLTRRTSPSAGDTELLLQPCGQPRLIQEYKWLGGGKISGAFVRGKYLHGWSHAQVIHSLAKHFRGRWCKWHPGDWEIWELATFLWHQNRFAGTRAVTQEDRWLLAPRVVFASQDYHRDSLRLSATWVMGSFMTRTSVTVPNCPKYSRSLSWLVCQLRPPTNSFPGAESELGVLRPLDSPCKMEPLIK